MDIDLDIKPKSIKFIDENKGKNLCDLGLDKDPKILWLFQVFGWFVKW